MSAHEWFLENREAYVARALDPRDERTFRDHLTRCPECAGAVAGMEHELRWLPMAVEPVAPRPGLEREVLERALGRRHWWTQWGVPTVAAAALLLSVGAWVAGRWEVGRLRETLGRHQAQVEALQDTLSAISGAQQIFQASFTNPEYEGGLLVFHNQRQGRWHVVVHGLPPAKAGQAYRLWFVTDSGMVHGALVQPRGQRPVQLTLAVPPDMGVTGATLTLEDDGRQLVEPRGEELARFSVPDLR